LESSLKEDKFVVPHSYCELGEMYLKEEKKQEAKEMFQKAKNFPTPYDFDRPLGYRISRGVHKAK
jgi:hypothetical protein